MPFDPYEILGVDAKAEAKAIHQAYRRASKKAHPDLGGSREAFDRLTLAYEVLKDPDRRARYDATGEIAGSEADNAYANLMGTLAHSLMRVFTAEKQAGHDCDNYVGAMRVDLSANILEWEKVKTEAVASMRKLDLAARRMARVDGGADNQLGRLVEGQKSYPREMIERADVEIANAKLALKFLDDYKDTAARAQTAFPANSGGPSLEMIAQRMFGQRMW